jgi:hypothetical protein
LYIVLFIITVTFPHPDCIWIYGNKDDDDDDAGTRGSFPGDKVTGA